MVSTTTPAAIAIIVSVNSGRPRLNGRRSGLRSTKRQHQQEADDQTGNDHRRHRLERPREVLEELEEREEVPLGPRHVRRVGRIGDLVEVRREVDGKRQQHRKDRRHHDRVFDHVPRKERASAALRAASSGPRCRAAASARCAPRRSQERAPAAETRAPLYQRPSVSAPRWLPPRSTSATYSPISGVPVAMLMVTVVAQYAF